MSRLFNFDLKSNRLYEGVVKVEDFLSEKRSHSAEKVFFLCKGVYFKPEQSDDEHIYCENCTCTTKEYNINKFESTSMKRRGTQIQIGSYEDLENLRNRESLLRIVKCKNKECENMLLGVDIFTKKASSVSTKEDREIVDLTADSFPDVNKMKEEFMIIHSNFIKQSLSNFENSLCERVDGLLNSNKDKLLMAIENLEKKVSMFNNKDEKVNEKCSPTQIQEKEKEKETLCLIEANKDFINIKKKKPNVFNTNENIEMDKEAIRINKLIQDLSPKSKYISSINNINIGNEINLNDVNLNSKDETEKKMKKAVHPEKTLVFKINKNEKKKDNKDNIKPTIFNISKLEQDKNLNRKRTRK